MKTYEEDLKELNIDKVKYDNIISYVYDKTNEEHVALAKAIRAGAKVDKILQSAFERVLNMRQTERQGAYNIFYGIPLYKITGYKVYEFPKNPLDNGLYYGKTPILEQAEGIIKRAKENGKLLFIKAVCSDGIERYMF